MITENCKCLSISLHTLLVLYIMINIYTSDTLNQICILHFIYFKSSLLKYLSRFGKTHGTYHGYHEYDSQSECYCHSLYLYLDM